MTKSREDIWPDWKSLVNMTPAKLAAWLDTDESKSVGWSADGGESVGHKSGRRIIEIRAKRKERLSDDDWAHIAKVVGYIKRHTAQGGPQKYVETSRWRYSLMNWGHDPMQGKVKTTPSKKAASPKKPASPKTAASPKKPAPPKTAG